MSKAKILKDSVHESFAINTLDWKECMWVSEHFSCWRGTKDLTVFGRGKENWKARQFNTTEFP